MQGRYKEVIWDMDLAPLPRGGGGMEGRRVNAVSLLFPTVTADQLPLSQLTFLIAITDMLPTLAPYASNEFQRFY